MYMYVDCALWIDKLLAIVVVIVLSYRIRAAFCVIYMASDAVKS